MNAKSKWLLLFVLVVDCVMSVYNSGVTALAFPITYMVILSEGNSFQECGISASVFFNMYFLTKTIFFSISVNERAIL